MRREEGGVADMRQAVLLYGSVVVYSTACDHESSAVGHGAHALSGPSTYTRQGRQPGKAQLWRSESTPLSTPCLSPHYRQGNKQFLEMFQCIHNKTLYFAM
jgi:hypothetical protein